jgi:hypothetical protein
MSPQTRSPKMALYLLTGNAHSPLHAEPAQPSITLSSAPTFGNCSSRVGFLMYRLAPHRAASALSACASEELKIKIGSLLHLAAKEFKNFETRPIRKIQIDDSEIGASGSISVYVFDKAPALSPSATTVISPCTLCLSNALRIRRASARFCSTRTMDAILERGTHRSGSVGNRRFSQNCVCHSVRNSLEYTVRGLVDAA